MKLSLFAVFALAAATSWAAPILPVEKAVAVAQKHLKERDTAGGTYIVSVKLESANAQRSSVRWSVTWSEPITLDASKKEIGVEIAMDGSLVSIVKGPSNKDPVTGNFDPNGPTGLANPRTRTERPSILDLKR